MYAQPSVADGLWDKVNISDVRDAGSFTVKLCGSEEEFTKMMRDVQKTCTGSTTPSPSASVGDAVLAQFSFDNQWYRGRVKCVNGDGTLQVTYVDYGNEETVERRNTRCAQSSLSLPRQGITCLLNRIDYSSNKLNKSHHDQFRTMCLNNTFTALFLDNTGEGWSVELFHPTGNVNDWFGKLSGSLKSQAKEHKQPAKLPYPHNAGLIAAKPPVTAVSAQIKTVDVPSRFEGSVVFANSPTEFWLQSNSDGDAVMNISAQLAEHCNSTSHRLRGSPVVGQYCAALYDTDMAWYRARVMQVSPTAAKVYFVDYGNTEEITLSNLADLPDQLTSQPEYAIPASLEGVAPVTGEKWNDDSIKAFSDLVLVATCLVQVAAKSSQTYLVNLTVIGESIADILVVGGHAKQCTPGNKVSPAAAAPNAAGAPNAAAVYSGGYNRQQVESNHKETVFISWLQNPAAFWVQKAGCEDILESVLEEAEKSAASSSPINSPAVGMACVAKYSADGAWYRGEIEACLAKSCTVLFIDYGNSEDISTHDIYPATAAISKTPVQSFKCSLLGIVPVDNSWSGECNALMEQLMAEGGCCTFLARHGDSYLVEMTYSEHDSLQDALVNANMAKRTRASSQVSDRSQGSHHSSSSVGRPKHTPITSVRQVERAHHADGAGDRTSPDAVLVPEASMANLGLMVGEQIVGGIVHINNADEIYVQLQNNKEQLDNVYNEMSLFYHSGKGKSVTEVVVNACYVVQFAQDGEWYRARVVSVNGANIEVFYVDYGNTETASLEKVRVLSPPFAKLACQGLCCSLHNYNKQLIADELKTFKDTYVFADVSGVVQAESSKGVVVDLYCGEDSLADLFAAKSLASSAASTPQRPQRPLRFSDYAIDSPKDVKGYLVFEVSQQQFYIQLAADTELIEQVTETVQQQSTNKQIRSPEVGQACIAKFRDDGAWYRAKITECAGEEVTVFFVDFGNSSLVDRSEVLQISEDLCKIRPLAIHCSLVAEDASKNLTEWALDELTVSVLRVVNDTALVSLTNNDGVQFVAKPMSNGIHTGSNSVISAHGGSSVSRQSSHSSPSRPNVEPCLQFPAQSTYNSDLKGYLVFEVSQQQFYIQLAADTELIEQVTETVQQQSTNKQIKSPEVGQACIAKFKDDGAWYRAKITECAREEVTVFFVDFGNSSLVDRSEVLQISENLCKIRPLAICCSLAAEDASKDLTEWASDELDILIEQVQGETYVVSLKDNSGSSFTPSPAVSSNISTSSNSKASSVQSTPQRVELQPCLNILDHPPLPETSLGYLSFEVSQKEFYIQLSADTELLEQVTEKVLQESSASQQIASPVVGQACIAKFKDDGAWYRAKITECAGVEVTVFFIDFGNSSLVDRTEVLQISEDLSKQHYIAVKCQLGPEDASKSLTEWAEDELTITVHDIRDGSHLVSLSNSKGPFTSPVSVSSDSVVQSTHGSDAIKSATPSQHSSHQSSPSRVDSQPCLRFPDDRQLAGEVSGYLSVEVSQGEFYIQLSNDVSLLEQLTGNVQAASLSFPTITSPVVGQACIAKFRDDGAWYRAKITECAGEEVTVFFVDFGNSSLVDRTEILQISEDLRQIPPFACRCNLLNKDTSKSLTQWAQDVIYAKIHSITDGAACVILRDENGPFAIDPASSPSHTNSPLLSSTPSVQSSTTSSPLRVYPIPSGSSHSTTSSQDILVALPPHQIPPGEHKGYITHIEDLDAIYIQLSSRSDELSQITELLARLGPSAEPEVYCPLGQACVATYSVDGLFYRGIVIDSDEPNGRSTILFIDYGTTEQVNNSAIKVLPPSLRLQCPVAFQCVCKQAEVVNMSAVQFAHAIDSKELSLLISGDNEPYDVEILNLPEGISGSNSANQSESTKFTANPTKYLELLPPVPSSDVMFTVSYIANPSHFYCHFDVDKMAQLQQSLDAVYIGNESVPLMPEEHLVSGTGCVVLTEKGKYSRALLLADVDNPSASCQALLVDYGITERVPATSIYQLHADCINFPKQAVRCSLGVIHPLNGSTWDDDAISRFYELAYNKQLLGNIVKVRQVAEETEVWLQIICSGESISETLTNAGFCSKVPTAETAVDKFCADLCAEVKEKILSSSQNRMAFLSDKSELFVNSLHPALDSQLDSMQEDEEGVCTAQDIVHHVTHDIINNILDLPAGAPLNVLISNKNMMKVEIQNIVAELLEEVMRMNNSIVENLMDEALSSTDNMTLNSCSDEETPSVDVPSVVVPSVVVPSMDVPSVVVPAVDVSSPSAHDSCAKEALTEVSLPQVVEPAADSGQFVELPNKVDDCTEHGQDISAAQSSSSTSVFTDDVTTDDVTTDDVTTDDVTTDDVTTNDVTTDDVTTDDGASDDVATDDFTTASISTDDATTDDVTVDDATRENITTDDVTNTE